jgi:zinc transport system ATP-binding protein
LSGGQQRRALIARALAGQPDVLVMDEPFAGVDAPNQQILARTLGDLVERGVTLLIVTHEVGPIGSLLDRAVVLGHGHVVHDGPPDRALLERYDGDPHAGSPTPTTETVQLGNLNGSS